MDKANQRQKSRTRRRHGREAGVGASAALAGAAAGSFAGAPGAAIGAVIGGVVGAVAGAMLDDDSVDRATHEADLDETIGVGGGDMGSPSTPPPAPATPESALGTAPVPSPALEAWLDTTPTLDGEP